MKYQDLTKKQRWAIADKLAEERLPIVNEKCKKVKVSNTIYSKYIKRLLDVFISIIVIAVTLPLNIVLAICTFFDVGRPVFFKQKRVGKNGKLFYIVKFRNMTNEKDEKGELLPPNRRVTKFGKAMRKSSLDELLNFWSILKGDMSLIGPRPLLPEYTHRYNNRHKARLCVRPGLECPPHNWRESSDSYQARFENDVWYVENISFKTDIKLLINLMRLVFDKKSTSIRAVAGRGAFTGYTLDGRAIAISEVPEEYIDKVLNDMNQQ